MAWKRMSWSYLAGFFDGEGCVFCREEFQADQRTTRRRFRLTIAQNYLPVLEEIQEFLAKKKIKSRIQLVTRKDARHQRGHVLEINGVAGVYKTLCEMEPFLRVKSDDAHKAICWIEELIEQAVENPGSMAPRAVIAYSSLAGQEV